MINCVNEGAINKSKRNLRRIRPGCSCANILRNLRNTRKKMSANIKYLHVDGHMDKYLFSHQLTLEQNMNTRCDILTKRVVHRVITTGTRREGKQLPPSEDAAVFVTNMKLTRDLAKTVRYEVGKEQARNDLINKEGWTGEQFNEMDRNRLHWDAGEHTRRL